MTTDSTVAGVPARGRRMLVGCRGSFWPPRRRSRRAPRDSAAAGVSVRGRRSSWSSTRSCPSRWRPRRWCRSSRPWWPRGGGARWGAGRAQLRAARRRERARDGPRGSGGPRWSSRHGPACGAPPRAARAARVRGHRGRSAPGGSMISRRTARHGATQPARYRRGVSQTDPPDASKQTRGAGRGSWLRAAPVFAAGLFPIIVGLLLHRAVAAQDRTNWNGAVDTIVSAFPWVLIVGGDGGARRGRRCVEPRPQVLTHGRSEERANAARAALPGASQLRSAPWFLTACPTTPSAPSAWPPRSAAPP